MAVKNVVCALDDASEYSKHTHKMIVSKLSMKKMMGREFQFRIGCSSFLSSEKSLLSSLTHLYSLTNKSTHTVRCVQWRHITRRNSSWAFVECKKIKRKCIHENIRTRRSKVREKTQRVTQPPAISCGTYTHTDIQRVMLSWMANMRVNLHILKSYC